MDATDFLAFAVDTDKCEVGMRIGVPILNYLIGQTPNQQLKDTHREKSVAHDFSLKGIDGGLKIGASVRWERFVEIPLTDRYQKTGETNCDGVALAHFLVNADHRVAIDGNPQMIVGNCTSSGFDLYTLFDEFVHAVTWVFSGGHGGFGMFDLFAGFATTVWDFSALINPSPIEVGDPVARGVLANNYIPFASALMNMRINNSEVFLNRIAYDPRGIWLMFSYPDWLNVLFSQLASKVGLPHAPAAGAIPVRLHSRASGKAMEAAMDHVREDGCKVRLWGTAPDQWVNQIWVIIEDGGGGSVRLRNAASGLFLDAVTPGSDKSGCRVQLWHPNGNPQQSWTIEDGGGGSVRIRSRVAGLVLEADGGHANEDDCQIRLWEDVNGQNQRWSKDAF